MSGRRRRRRTAGAAFIHSQLTPLFIAGLAGARRVGGRRAAARRRAADRRADGRRVRQMPGATPAEVEQRVTRPMEQLLWEVPGRRIRLLDLEPGQSMVIVRFKVGEDEEAALVRLNQKLAANADRIPPGVSTPARQAALDRRRADPGADALGRALRRRPAAAAGRAAAGRHRRSHRRVRSDAHRRAAAAGHRDARLGRAWPRTASTAGRSSTRSARPTSRAVGHAGRSRPRRSTARRRESPARGADATAAVVTCAATSDAASATWRRSRWRRERRATTSTFHAAQRRRAAGGHDRRRQAQGHQRHRRHARGAREARHAARRIVPSDVHLDGHARLRRDGGREEQRAAVAHAARRALGLGADLARARPARGGGRAHRDSGHARADAVHVLPLRLHAEPHHAVRADLLDRHPRGRRDRGGREHRAPRADAAARIARRSGPSSRFAPWTRSATPTILATLDGGRGDPADGVRRRPDGPVHAPDSGRRVGGDGLLARSWPSS